MNKSDKQKIARFFSERNSAVKAVVDGEDIRVFKAFVSKWQDLGFYPPCFALPTDEILEAGVRKMAIHSIGIDDDTKREATYWLLTHGYTTDI